MNSGEPSQAEGDQDADEKDDVEITLTVSFIPTRTEPAHVSPQTADDEAEDDKNDVEEDEDEEESTIPNTDKDFQGGGDDNDEDDSSFFINTLFKPLPSTKG
ncbi:hypothetical protein L6452_19642 [Arctium lappa]|uniref:Uncharacterized protein n=1 Tax=Arctium lappa TaxID=4217 RepID=A0ACB9B8Q5_ARCLA|nr:hypothetical protein L6452_19642 [Arctium lappa]